MMCTFTKTSYAQFLNNYFRIIAFRLMKIYYVIHFIDVNVKNS